LEETLGTFAVRLERFKLLLVDRVGEERLRQAAERILELSVDLLVCCQTYMSFVHEAWLESQPKDSLAGEAGGLSSRRPTQGGEKQICRSERPLN
jgi:hypothetical protein